ncbi:P-loop NTPase fold protein [Lachnospiraceae bacterium CLA-AA-H185]|uniref:P-loop NTPase fold protein n=1 Tax=Maccoyibacter intestinihominis TaxID=3133499 RepID=A0ABV1HGB8_9FIRM
MRADCIYDIIKKFGCFSYDCILFDGPWGIGKTYAIDKALEEQENVCSISMFGLQNSQQIYHEVLCQFVLKNNKAGKIAGAATEVLDGISNIWKSVSSVKEVLQSIAREKELFLLLSKGFDSLHIIVIDDLERVSDRINIEEVFGIVEELKKCNNVKIILVANIDELQENNKEIFKKHNEKVIDRIYHITEKPEKINWGEIGIHAGFMQEFLSVHKVKNLRTLKKAQRFYDDVYILVNQIDNQQFKDEIRLICFAIVVESTDNLYYKQNDNEDDSNKKIFNELHNELLYRILLYLQEVRSSRNLVNILLEYYNNQIVLSTSDIMLEYKIFLQAGNKPNYFKTDDEIRRILPKIEDDIVKATTIGELNRNADEYEMWSETIGEDNASMLDKYREIVRNLLWNEVKKENEDILGYSYDLWHLEAEKVKEIYEEERNAVRKMVIQHYVDYLKETTKGKMAFEYSRKLREYCANNYYKEIIKENIDKLYNRKSFPVDEIDSVQYHTCYNIMSVLYHINQDRFLEYSDELSKQCDNMSAHRMDVLIREIIRIID